MGTGKKLANAKSEMTMLKLEAIQALDQAQARHDALIEELRRLERSRARWRLAVLLVVACWALFCLSLKLPA